MHVAEICTVKGSKEEAQSVLIGVAYIDDASHSAVGVRPDPDAGGHWLAVIINHDAPAESDEDLILESSNADPVEKYLERHPEVERYTGDE